MVACDDDRKTYIMPVSVFLTYNNTRAVYVNTPLFM